jgi:undecaprenyl-phosphate galactose phosphotransferase/putative colanic acid biosynthesis UDP-glucose lipid carrier transferase
MLQKLAAFKLSRYFKIGFVLWDVLLLNIAILVSLFVRFGNLPRLDQLGQLDNIAFKEFKTISFLSNIIWISLLLHKDAYRIIRVERIESIVSRTMRLLMIHGFLVFFTISALDFSALSKLRLVYFYLFFFLLILIFRFFFMKILKYVRSRGYNFRTVIIIGANEKGNKIAEILAQDLTFGYRVMGFFDNQKVNDPLLSTPILGKLDCIQNYIINQKVDEMYVALHIDDIMVINQLTELCEHYMVRIKFIPDFQLYTKSRKVEIDFYENLPVLVFRREPLEVTLNRLVKKIFDVVFSLCVIVFIFPWLFPILFILIKLDSPGPIFFMQERSGRDNKAFWCIKFRTMRTDKRFDASQQATVGDSRITKMGSFMRKTNLDELPQFFNVLIGNMSVVGPRPHMLKHTEQYCELINDYLVRHYAKPGITGWAQVNGLRGETKELIDMKNRVESDIWYIENWIFFLDIKIIYRTVFNIFKGEENAY